MASFTLMPAGEAVSLVHSNVSVMCTLRRPHITSAQWNANDPSRGSARQGHLYESLETKPALSTQADLQGALEAGGLPQRRGTSHGGCRGRADCHEGAAEIF